MKILVATSKKVPITIKFYKEHFIGYLNRFRGCPFQKLKIFFEDHPIDESTMNDNEALLMTHVRYVRDVVSKEEMLFSKPIEHIKGESILAVVTQFCEQKRIRLRNIVACATDGAPSMIGRHRGFIAHLKRAVHNIFIIIYLDHCLISKVAVKFSRNKTACWNNRTTNSW